MTREEAVAVLKAFMENPLFSDVHKAAFNIAIHDIKQRHDWDINNLILINKDNYEPLEQEPITKNDLVVDAVSRQAVLDLIADYDLSMGQVVRGIHALSSVTPQPCEDAISRADALNCLAGQIELNPSDVPAVNKYLKGVDKRLHELSSVIPQSRWIPVSEKLPNDRDWYLGTFKEPDTGWINPLPFICDYVGHETKATTKEHWILHGFTDRDEHIDYYFNLECVKWMPLPSDYKKGEKV